MERVTDIMALKKIMLENNLERIGDLATAAGVCRQTLGKVLKGEMQPTAETMWKLVATLGIPAEKAGEIFFSSNLHSA